jgi:ribulose-phosphate 3-epimerase
MIELCASLLAANHAHIARDVAAVEGCGVKRLHFDVCDGHYTRNIIFGNQLIKDLRVESKSYFDVHLAVYKTASILETFLECGAQMINIQYESCEHPEQLIKIIHAHSLDAGICFVPATGFNTIKHFIGKVEAVNLLAVNPGIGGQQFDYSVLDKIKKVTKYIKKYQLRTKVSVDGGVNLSTLKDVIDAGADIAIIGSGIFSGNITGNIQRLQVMITNL